MPLHAVETALLVGSLRRLIRPAGAPPLSPIRSLAYFRPVIEELQHIPCPLDISITFASSSAKPPQYSAGGCPENYVF